MILPKSIFALTPTVDKNRTKQDAKKKKNNDIDSDIEFLKQNSELNDPDKIMSLTKDIKFYLLKLWLPASLFTLVPVSSFNYFFRGLKALDQHCSQSGMDLESGIHKIAESDDVDVIKLFKDIDIISEVKNSTKIRNKKMAVTSEVLNDSLCETDTSEKRQAKKSPYYIDLSIPTDPFP